MEKHVGDSDLKGQLLERILFCRHTLARVYTEYDLIYLLFFVGCI